MPSPQPAVRMVNLGCAKNLVDAEEMLGVLQLDGFSLPTADGAADVVVINTCGFIKAAKDESIDAILKAVEQKRQGVIKRVVVTGCLAQRYGSELAAQLPEVDSFMGAGQMGRISDTIRLALQSPTQTLQIPAVPHHHWVDTPRFRTTAPWTAWLKISEGCDHRCTFCAIPSFRGAHASKPIERIVAEARQLADGGAVEINLIAQDSTQYGFDLYGRCRLPELLERLSEVDGIRWIRLFYCYPSRVTGEIVRALAQTPKVCHYVDMPLQHADDAVLKTMRRPTNNGRYLKLIRDFREAAPDAAIRTTFIVGFPGETDQQFEALLQFVREAELDRVGVFEYSTEDGTPSADLPARVPARIKRERRKLLMETQEQISLRCGSRWIGRTLEVLIEQSGTAAWKPAIGRSFRDAPDIDGTVAVHNCTLRPGEFATVRITAASPHDLTGEMAVEQAA